MEYRYCPLCAAALEPRPSPGHDPDRLGCPRCSFVHYGNPAPTVQAWIDCDGRYLALRRDEEPLCGEWNMPGGFVEAGESGEEAIVREVREETGLLIEVVEPIGIFASAYGTDAGALPIFDVAYRCRIAAGAGDALDVSAESSEARWFPLAEFPRPAFAGERKALAKLRELHG